MRRAAALLTAPIFATLLVAGCGGTASPESQPGPRFSLTVLPDTYVAGGKAAVIKLSQRSVDGLQAVEIRATGAEDLRAAFFTLDYDPSLLSPLRIEGNPALSADGQGLSLSLLGQAGHLEYGAMQLRPQDGSVGLSGDALLATVWFEHRAFSARRRTSTPPTSDSSRTPIFYESTISILTWYYYNQGDYNQDGRVAVSDLTPIGIHFGDTVPTGTDPDGRNNLSIEDVIDGSNDGRINVQDLSAIGQNYGNQVDAYQVYVGDPLTDYPASNGAVSTLSPQYSLPFSAATGNPSKVRLAYSTPVSNAPAGQLFWARPQDNAGVEGTPSEKSVPYLPSWHQTLIDDADFAGYRSKLFVRKSFEGKDVPALVYFRQATSGTGYCYASDNDVHGADLSFLSELAPSQGFAGDGYAAFSSDDGQMFMCQKNVFTNVMPVYNCASGSLSSWLYTRDADAPSELVRSLNGQMVLGQPAFSYYRDTLDPNDGLLMYNYFDGANYNPVVVAGGFGTFDYGKYNSLAVINGVPAIAYYDAQSQNLWYIRANDLLGTSWPANGVQVEAGGVGIDTGLHVVLLEVGGRPAVFYQENGVFASRIMYKWADDSLGAGWPGSGVVVGTSDNPWEGSIPFSAATDGSETGVVYLNKSSVRLRMLSDPAGSFDAEELVTNGILASPSMAILGGQPAFSIYVNDIQDLYFLSKY